MYAKYFYLLQNVKHFVISVRVTYFNILYIRITPFKMIKFQNADIELYLST